MKNENQLPSFVSWDKQLVIQDEEGAMNVGVLIPEEILFTPIVLVHGWLGSGETWGRVAQELVKEGYIVYCPDVVFLQTQAVRRHFRFIPAWLWNIPPVC